MDPQYIYGFRNSDSFRSYKTAFSNSFSSLEEDDSLESNSVFQRSERASNEIYSRRVFIGGIPRAYPKRFVENVLACLPVGEFVVEWPTSNRRICDSFLFMVFQKETSVSTLVSLCTESETGYWLCSFGLGAMIHVRPFLLIWKHYFLRTDVELDSGLASFLGGVPRTASAADIVRSVELLIGRRCVVYASLHCDQYGYPKGAARVVFVDFASFLMAMKIQKVAITVPNHCIKEAEIKPYFIRDMPCDECNLEEIRGAYASIFCRDCGQCFCKDCFQYYHNHNAYVNHVIIPCRFNKKK